MNSYDVFAFGVVSSSTLYSVEGDFPAAEGYAEISAARYMTGGEAANSSIVLSRLGARVRIDGNWIGADEAGRRTKALLDEYGIDSSRLPLRDDYSGASEVVFAADGTRTIFGTYGRLLEKGEWNTPQDSDIRRASVICLDPFFGAASYRVAEIGTRAGIPVVTVDCRCDDPILGQVSAAVIAESFIRENYPEHDLEALFREYQKQCPGMLVFTFGGDGSWFAPCGERRQSLEAYQVEPVDTTGGGDAFRAGIAFGYLQQWDPARTVRFASAVAALNCTRFPGVMNAPDYAEVVAFIKAGRS